MRIYAFFRHLKQTIPVMGGGIKKRGGWGEKKKRKT
jgi:hypothetical protein